MDYIEILRSQFATHRAAIEGIQKLAVDGSRTFTPDELAKIAEHRSAAEVLVPQIEQLAQDQARSARVDAAAGQVAASTAAAAAAQAQGAAGAPVAQGAAQGSAGGSQTRSAAGDGPGHLPGTPVGSTTTQDRDPGHYTQVRSAGFFGDIVRAQHHDRDAIQRLDEHSRALSTGAAGAGLVPPKWLTEEYEHIARQGRVVSAAVRQIGLGSDPRPFSLPGQTSGTDSVVAQQSSENTHPSETDGYASTAVLVSPKPTSGIQVISRQMLDMADPAIDALIYQDLIAVYNRKVEDAVVAAMVASAGTAVSTLATEAAFMGTPPAMPASDAVTAAAIAVWNARKLPATGVIMRISRWGKFSTIRDTTGRKLFPLSDAGPMNVDGVGSVQAAGSVEGLPVLPTDGIGIGGATYPETILVARLSDTIFFESPVMRFRYEEVAGPESIKLGIWAYTAVAVRQAANSVRKIVVTAA